MSEKEFKVEIAYKKGVFFFEEKDIGVCDGVRSAFGFNRKYGVCFRE